MKLIAAAENTLSTKITYFMAVFVPSLVLTVYTVVKSKRLSAFLEALADERLSRRDKLNLLASVWKKKQHSARDKQAPIPPHEK